MNELKKVVFFGSDAIALPVLETLISAPLRALVRIEAIYTQPDRPSGRGQKIQPNAIAQWAKDFKIPLYQPEKLGEEDVARLKEIGCDIGLVMAYGHILKQDMLDAPTLGFFNYHASLLPHFRGPAPIEAAIASGDTGTGVTLQRIVPALDQGDVVGSAVIPLDNDSTRASLRERISEACTFITIDTLPRIIRGDAERIVQPEKHASYTRKISRADSAIDFSVSAKMIAARTRALSPWPGCTFPFNGMEIKLAVVSGTANAEKLLNKVKAGEADYHFIEVMGCPGGCVNGGGQPHQPASVRNFTDIRAKRAEALYAIDAANSIRRSHENPAIKSIYDEFFGEPNSHKAHEVLHTTYVKRGLYNNK